MSASPVVGWFAGVPLKCSGPVSPWEARSDGSLCTAVAWPETSPGAVPGPIATGKLLTGASAFLYLGCSCFHQAWHLESIQLELPLSRQPNLLDRQTGSSEVTFTCQVTPHSPSMAFTSVTPPGHRGGCVISLSPFSYV